MAYVDINKIQISREFEDILTSLSKDDYNILEKSLLESGFNPQFGRIKVWFPENVEGIGYIIDGHNRYKICKHHNIKLTDRCFEAVSMDSKEEVIKWMFENQLARRNLSPVDKFRIIEKYTEHLKMLAKKNQSNRGLINPTKINVQKEKAKLAGISSNSFYKLNKIMKSDNEEVKRWVKNNEISIDKAYQMVCNPTLKKEKTVTPQQQIEKLDNRIQEIDKNVNRLIEEREEIVSKIKSVFELLGIECPEKYMGGTIN